MRTDFPPGNFIPEDKAAFEIRYIGFGKELYDRIAAEMPEIALHLRLYKDTGSQPEDSYAEYDDGSKCFAIQLDPICEVIVIWNNENVHAEFGTWSPDACAEAMALMEELTGGGE